MGVDLNCYIKSHANANDIAAALAIFAGNKPNWRISHNEKYEVFDHSGLFQFQVYINNESDEPEKSLVTHSDEFLHPMISFKHPEGHYSSCMLFIESNQGAGKYKMIGPRSTPYWIALSKKLLQLFGGKMYYSDSNSSYDDSPDYEVKNGIIKPWHYSNENEGYIARNAIMLSLEPITSNDLVDANQHAAYSQQIDSSEWNDLLNAMDQARAWFVADKLKKTITPVSKTIQKKL